MSDPTPPAKEELKAAVKVFKRRLKLANHAISISSVIQHQALDGHEGDIVPLVIMTHIAPTGHFLATVAELDRLSCVTAPSVYYHVGD